MRDIIVTSAALRRSLDLGDYIPELERNGATAPPSTGPYSVGCDGLPVHSYGRYGTLAQAQEADASVTHGSLRWRGYCETHGGIPAYVQARKAKVRA